MKLKYIIALAAILIGVSLSEDQEKHFVNKKYIVDEDFAIVASASEF